MSPYYFRPWERYGRGRCSRDFYITDEELYAILLGSLPEKYSPYSLVLPLSVQTNVWRKGSYVYKQSYKEININDFLDARKEGQWKYFLRSHYINPNPLPLDISQISEIFAVSGMVDIDHGSIHHRIGIDRSSVGCIDKIVNDETGEMISHEGYYNIYKVLDKAIKKILMYKTQYTTSGSCVIHSKYAEMSKTFAEKVISGEIKTSRRPVMEDYHTH